jgi:hypothetical protein
MLAPITTARRGSDAFKSLIVPSTNGVPALVVEGKDILNLAGREGDLRQGSFDARGRRSPIGFGDLADMTGDRRFRLGSRQARGYFHWASHFHTTSRSHSSWFCKGRFAARRARISAIFSE